MKRVVCALLGLVLVAVMALAVVAEPFLPVFGSRSPLTEQRYTVALSRGQSPSFAPDELERRLGLFSENLRAVTFTRLPEPADGILMLAGKQVEPYVRIPRQQLEKLVFLPSGSGEASFTLLPDADQAVAATLAYTMQAAPNSPPTVKGASYETLQGVRRYGRLVASDPDGDRLSYRLVTPPKKGQVTIVGDAFIYTPLPGAKGKDRFAFCVQDERGNLSPVGAVNIQIEKLAQSPYFTDLQGSRYEYAAVKLAEAGVLSGERFGGSRLFYPERKVTGGELVVMVLAAAGLDSNLAPCINTGLENDGEIPLWLKPYLNRAREAGVITGASFDPAAVPKRSEAVELICRAAGVKPPQRLNLRLRDVGEIPTGALPAYMALAEEGLLEHYDGYSTPAAPLDRGYAAGLLWGLYSRHS